MIGTEPVRALVDIGFIALSRMLDRHAETIFRGVAAARPDNETGPMGLALVELQRANPAVAARMLKALPPSDQVLVFYAMALVRLGDRPGAVEVLDRLMASTTDEAILSLAAALRAEA